MLLFAPYSYPILFLLVSLIFCFPSHRFPFFRIVIYLIDKSLYPFLSHCITYQQIPQFHLISSALQDSSTNMHHQLDNYRSSVEGWVCYLLTELKWTELKWTELNWNELNWNELKWNELHWNELKWTEMNWHELKWTEMNWNELKWTELDISQTHEHIIL